MLKLIFGDLDLTIYHVLEARFPRTRADPVASLEYSVAGTPIIDGPSFEPKYIWQISCLLEDEEAAILRLIYNESDKKRRTAPYGGNEILIFDYFDPVEEKVPRTRAIAPDAVETLVKSGYISYFAQFKGFLLKEPEFTKTGIYKSANFTLVESSKILA